MNLQYIVFSCDPVLRSFVIDDEVEGPDKLYFTVFIGSLKLSNQSSALSGHLISHNKFSVISEMFT